jgi:hypothetical protein
MKLILNRLISNMIILDVSSRNEEVVVQNESDINHPINSTPKDLPASKSKEEEVEEINRVEETKGDHEIFDIKVSENNGSGKIEVDFIPPKQLNLKIIKCLLVFLKEKNKKIKMTRLAGKIKEI